MRIGEIKNEAKERFAINRYHAMLAYLIIFAVGVNFAVVVSLSLTLAFTSKWSFFPWLIFAYGILLVFVLFLAIAPFNYGMTDFYLKSYRYEKADAFHVFDGFNKHNLERILILHLIKTGLTICFSLLLIVPGVIYSIRTSMAVYLLKMNPKMKATEALRASNKIMKGKCVQYFLLSLSFAGWFFAGIATFTLGFIWVTPYFNVSKIVFYKRIIQGDKTVYRRNDDGTYSVDDTDSYAEEEQDEEEDDKNIAVKLMKLQLETEIMDMENKIKTANTKTNPETKAAVSSNTKPLAMDSKFTSSDKPKSMNEVVNDVVEMIEQNTVNVKTSVIQQPDDAKESVKAVQQPTNQVVKQDDKVMQTVRPSAAPTVSPPEIRQSATPVQSSRAQTETRLTAAIPRQSSVNKTTEKPVLAPIRPPVQEKPLVMPNKSLPETRVNRFEVGESDKNNSENIRERLERMKDERINRRNISNSRISNKTRSNANDEFAPEKISIEIDEDDN